MALDLTNWAHQTVYTTVNTPLTFNNLFPFLLHRIVVSLERFSILYLSAMSLDKLSGREILVALTSLVDNK